MSADATPEFSRPVAVDRLGAGETVLEVAAEPRELAALAERFRILAVDSLKARLRLRRIAGSGLIRLHGSLTARVVQSCVVTLEPVTQDVAEEFEMLFGESADPDDIDVLVHYDEEDPPEPILHGAIDVGEAVAEHLALGLDPFPRRPDACFTLDADAEQAPEEPEKPSPFAALAKLQRKEG